MHPFNKLASPFCLFMPNLDIPTVYFYQPNKGTLAELPPGSLWFCTPWWWFHSGVFTCHTQQRRAPGTFRVGMCAWDKGKTEVIWKLLCFCSYKFGFSYPVARPALQSCEVNKACFCHPHLPLAPSSILSVSNQLPSCQSLPRAQSSGWSGVTIGAVAPGQPGWAAKMYPTCVGSQLRWERYQNQAFSVYSLPSPLFSDFTDLGWGSCMCILKISPG